MGCAPFESDGVMRMGATWKSKGGLSAAEWETFGYSPRRRSRGVRLWRELGQAKLLAGDAGLETVAVVPQTKRRRERWGPATHQLKPKYGAGPYRFATTPSKPPSSPWKQGVAEAPLPPARHASRRQAADAGTLESAGTPAWCGTKMVGEVDLETVIRLPT